MGVGLLTLGLALLTAGNNEEAIKALSKAVQLAPNDAESRGLRGKANLALRHYKSAIADLDAAVLLDPDMKIELAKELEEVKSRRE